MSRWEVIDDEGSDKPALILGDLVSCESERGVHFLAIAGRHVREDTYEITIIQDHPPALPAREPEPEE